MSHRLLDILVSAGALVVAAPVLAISAVLIRRDGGPALFTQDRVGRDGRVFGAYKLRSMIVDADRYLDADGKPTRERITPIGRFIRRTSIDELPQLLNVLKGDMSLIGPRPILPMMLPYLTDRERRRLTVRPGLTGLAQVKGRNNLLWSRRFRYDAVYVRRQSLGLDLWIAWATVKMLLRGDGVAHDRNPGQVQDVLTRTLVADHAAG